VAAGKARGVRITCPKCGKPGLLGVDVSRAKGRVYLYVVARHYEGGRRSKCVLLPVRQGVEQFRVRVAELGERVAELERENKWLRQLLAQARDEAERLARVLGEAAALARQAPPAAGAGLAVLQALLRSEHPLASREIAQRAQLPRRTVDYWLSRLIEQGYVERVGKPHSRAAAYALKSAPAGQPAAPDPGSQAAEGDGGG
jgi:DNA-binding transcriptional ArsR family regulator